MFCIARLPAAVVADTTSVCIWLFVAQVQRPGALALARAVAGKAGFRLLALDDNAISEEGVEQIQELLKVGVVLLLLCL